MGFIVGVVIGLIVGITIIIGFVKAETYRSKIRSELVRDPTTVFLTFIPLFEYRNLFLFQANTVAAFARMTVEDSRKLLPADFYPSWVVFSERQKLSSNFDAFL